MNARTQILEIMTPISPGSRSIIKRIQPCESLFTITNLARLNGFSGQIIWFCSVKIPNNPLYACRHHFCFLAAKTEISAFSMRKSLFLWPFLHSSLLARCFERAVSSLGFWGFLFFYEKYAIFEQENERNREESAWLPFDFNRRTRSCLFEPWVQLHTLEAQIIVKLILRIKSY